MPRFLTVPDIARRLNVNVWAVRRAVDRLGIAVRVGLYRLVPEDKVEAVEQDLARRGAKRQEASCA
jgi:hypothetical protein